ncbi:MAG: 2-oxoacid:acceptor oxidoreductase family protein [Sulfolobales archaeon]|nr:2-oxoacid:acceptor oxidoreductase family protein [Sulfolobales archaeon]MDW8083533.1 2-oxoacid:acceptor oxidoreductase family protein [Sulfolobales archaeon]
MGLAFEKEVVEIRFHGRGGQGAVTAAHLLVDAAMRENLWGAAFPFFGAERRGAPVTAYARVSRRVVSTKSMIKKPDVVVVLDQAVMNYVNVFDGIKNGGVAVINSATHTLPSTRLPAGVRIHTVDATRIALDFGLVLAGWPLVNIAMVGALARILGMKLSSVLEAVNSILSGRAAELNSRAAERAYREVVEVEA